ncbi:hypothetical protein GCM10027589_35450 [Actinocorallia lasiicapitis]
MCTRFSAMETLATGPCNGVNMLTHLFTNGVERALGRSPRDFADYARATASQGIWSTK